jgi:serine/threonine-protein kinase
MDRAAPIVGQTLGHYRVVEKVGEGGMGVVYRAHDERLGRDVALKVLPSELVSNKAARERLLDEAQTVSSLNHPHICTIHEVGEAGGLAYIVMEYVEGLSLSEATPREGLPIETAVRYAAQIADALAHSHQRGIVHRDLKSSNVVITPESRVKVLDFGLARRLPLKGPDADTRSDLSLEEGREIAGTLAYLAPEVLRGEAANEQSDIWALGVILYEMATGAKPFQGETEFAHSTAILRDPPAPLPANFPTGLGAVIQRCLAKELPERYQRASELLAALQAIQSNVGIIPSAPAKRRSARVINSLAVLPFENATGDPQAEYLSDGITESLINSLAQLPKLRVMARSAVFRFKGQRVDPQTAGRDLNVHAVLVGRVSQRDDSLLITAELVDVANGWQLWSEQFNRPRADIFLVQDQIAKEISERLRLRLTGADKKRLTKRYTENTEAYHLYLKGRFYWNKRTQEDLRRGLDYFNQAIEKDPHFALAYAGLADSYYLLSSTAYAAFSATDALPRAKAAARRALEIDGALAEAHASLASILTADWDWPAAEKAYKRSIKLNPHYATVRQWYAFYLTAMGRLEEALAEAQHAHELDPLSVIINRDLGMVYYYARQPDRAIEQYRKSLELDPSFALVHQSLGRAYLLKGMHAEALAAMQKAVSLGGETVAMSSALAHAYAVSGQPSEAQKILNELLERSRRSYVSPTNIAVIYAGLDERESAFAWLEKAFGERNVGLFTLKVHPVSDGLRSDPRYRDLLRRMNFPI